MNRTVEQPSLARTRLDDSDLLILIRLCVANQDEYVDGKKGDFWTKIGILLQQETGKRLRDPASTVKNLVVSRKIIVTREVKESGTVQCDTEITQALDQWITRIETIEREKQDTFKTKGELDKEIQEASIRRGNLLKPQSLKRPAADDIEREHGNNSKQSPTPHTKKARAALFLREQLLDRELEASHKDTESLVGAVKEMGTQMAEAIKSLTETRQLNMVHDSDGAQARLSNLEARGERHDLLLEQILEHVTKLTEKKS